MKVRIYPASGAWWIVQDASRDMFMSTDGQWRNWATDEWGFVNFRKMTANSPEWKKKYINSRRLAIAVAKKSIRDVKIEFPVM